MRKLPSHYECPIDNFILNWIDTSGIMKFFWNYGFTPNILTTLGNISRGVSIWALLKGHGVIFLLTAFIGYLFDCFDGHFARKYDMCTTFGDYYDHISDVVYNGIIIFLILSSTAFQKRPTWVRWSIYLVLAIFLFLTMVHFGCQEHHFVCGNNCSVTLSPIKNICRDKENISWTKYLGSGTFMVFLYLLAFWNLNYKGTIA